MQETNGWTAVKENEYTAEMTDLPVKHCPKCRETIMEEHLAREVKNYDEPRFLEFCHPCGARLTIVNQ